VINNMTGEISWEDIPFNEYGTVDSIEDLVNVVAEFKPDVEKYPQPVIWVSKGEAVFFPYSDSQNYFSLQLLMRSTRHLYSTTTLRKWSLFTKGRTAADCR